MLVEHKAQRMMSVSDYTNANSGSTMYHLDDFLQHFASVSLSVRDITIGPAPRLLGGIKWIMACEALRIANKCSVRVILSMDRYLLSAHYVLEAI